ncbi:MAG: GTP pyrophosphokinase family protein [Coprococcus sp.]
MINTLDTIMNEYYQRIEIYKKMQHDVEDIINTLIEVHQIKISTMSLRIKTEQALRNKIISKNKYLHLEDITDILGCRILTLFETDIEKILNLLEQTFEVCEIVDKRKKNKRNRIEFGYSSVHLVVKFTDERCNLVEYQKYQDIRFEIQLRTVLQHAWAEVEHGLGYKSYYEPPMDITRKLNRLAGTLELLDEEFETIRYEISLYNQSMNKVEKILKTDINKESLTAFADKSELVQELVQQVAEKHNFTIVHDPAILSQQRLVAKLNFYGYQYIHELNDDMYRYRKSILAIGEELSQKINYDISSINYYSPILWFSFVPVIKNLLAGHEASSDNIVDDVILEAFKMNNGSIINFFMEHRLQ